jgi:hypothetical protein
LERAKSDEDRTDIISYYEKILAEKLMKEADEKWEANNLEAEFRSTDWILAKARASESYAQNIYAALCNNQFVKLDGSSTEPWSCSWRYAGGIVADMREEGDYIDWYCSGIYNPMTGDEIAELTPEQHDRYMNVQSKFVNESVITDEIAADLATLGWVAVKE